MYALKPGIEDRCVEFARYIAETGATVRTCAARFGISKSSVHKDVTERLPHINPSLAAQVRTVLDLNKAERHIRGGMATKMKYKKRTAENKRLRGL